jgi:hypothetical protein
LGGARNPTLTPPTFKGPKSDPPASYFIGAEERMKDLERSGCERGPSHLSNVNVKNEYILNSYTHVLKLAANGQRLIYLFLILSCILSIFSICESHYG